MSHSRCGFFIDRINSAINLEHNTRLESSVIHPFEDYTSKPITIYPSKDHDYTPELSHYRYIPRIISQIKSPLIELIELTVVSLTVEELSQWSVLRKCFVLWSEIYQNPNLLSCHGSRSELWRHRPAKHSIWMLLDRGCRCVISGVYWYSHSLLFFS